jgi:hypothetical protein
MRMHASESVAPFSCIVAHTRMVAATRSPSVGAVGRSCRESWCQPCRYRPIHWRQEWYGCAQRWSAAQVHGDGHSPAAERHAHCDEDCPLPSADQGESRVQRVAAHSLFGRRGGVAPVRCDCCDVLLPPSALLYLSALSASTHLSNRSAPPQLTVRRRLILHTPVR